MPAGRQRLPAVTSSRLSERGWASDNPRRLSWSSSIAAGSSGATRHRTLAAIGGVPRDQQTVDNVRACGRRHDAGRRLRSPAPRRRHQPRPSRQASPPARRPSQLRRAPAQSLRPRRQPPSRRSRPATPSWTRRSAPTSRSTARPSRSRPSGSVARARTSPRPSPTSRPRPASRSRSTASARATRPCCGRASRAASRPTSRCSPSRRPSWPTRADGKVIDVATFMDRQEARRRAPGHHRPRHRGQQHLGHPVQGRRQVDRLVPDQGLRGRGLRGPHDVGRADRPVRQDRRRRHQPVVRQAWRSRRRDRLADHRLGRGSRPPHRGPRGLQPVDQPRAARSTRPRSRKPSTASARSSSRTVRLRRAAGDHRHRPDRRRWTRCSIEDLAAPECWMQKIPTWYGPDFFPDAARKRPTPSKYVIGEDIGIFYFPTIDPAQAQRRRWLGRHAHGARRPARSPGRRPVPRRRRKASSVDRGGQRHLGQQHDPAGVVRGLLQARGRCRDREQRAVRLRRLRPDAAAVGAGTFWTEAVEWVNDDGADTDGDPEGHRRQLARQS